MPVPSWQLQSYEPAAMAMCQTLGENPHEIVAHANGEHMPQWASYALDMYKLRLMQMAMQSFGPHGPVY